MAQTPDITIPGSYISVMEATAADTGIDVNDLDTGVLARYIARASRWVDRVCKQAVYGTVQTEILRRDLSLSGWTYGRGGKVHLYPSQFPIRFIDTVGYQFSALDTPQLIPQNTWTIFERSVEVDPWAFFGGRATNISLQYESGLPVSLSTNSIDPGDNTVTMKAYPAGKLAGSLNSYLPAWLPGDELEVQDGVGGSEIVTVASITGLTVTINGTFEYSHATDTMLCSPLLSNVQLGTIFALSYILKTRGVGPLELEDEAIRESAKDYPEASLLMDARDVLNDWIVNA